MVIHQRTFGCLLAYDFSVSCGDPIIGGVVNSYCHRKGPAPS